MKKMLKKTMAGVMIAALAAGSLAGCGGSSKDSGGAGGQGGSGNAGGESAGPISGQTLQVMISEEPGEGDALGSALNKWPEESGNLLNMSS